MDKTDIISGIPDDREFYDKISVVIVTLNENVKSHDRFINMMNTLLSPAKPVEKKKEELISVFHIQMENGFGKELELMCNLSGYVEEWAMEKGMEKGIEKGRKDGRRDGIYAEKERIVLRMLELGYPEEEIIKIANISPKQFENITQSLTKK